MSHRRPPGSSVLERCEQPVEAGERAAVGRAVDPLGPEMALKGGDHAARGVVEPAVARGRIAEADELVLEPRGAARPPGARLRPQADAGGGETRPVEQLARVLLALRCYVAVAEHPARRDRPARDDRAAELDAGRVLG